jgi:glycosyltransferase involved in cell wall biosynthesis
MARKNVPANRKTTNRNAGLNANRHFDNACVASTAHPLLDRVRRRTFWPLAKNLKRRGSPRVHILEIISGTTVNGAITHCRLLTGELLARGHTVTLVCRGGAWIGEQFADHPHRERLHILPSTLKRWPLKELRRVAHYCREQQVDVAHTHMSSAHFFGVLLRRLYGVPCVASAHNRFIQPHWTFNDHVIATSEATRRFHAWFNLVLPHRITTIHNFIDAGRFINVPAEARARIRREFGVGNSTLLIGSIGQICPRKDQFRLVQAMYEVVRRFPGAKLVIVGPLAEPNEYLSAVRAEIARLNLQDVVLWPGERRDIPEILSALDLFVLSSIEETLPLVILESMAAGVPVVATRVGGIAEMVEHRHSGLLVPRKDHHALAEAIVEALEHPDRRLSWSATGRKRVAANFSLAGQVTKIEHVLEQVANRRRAVAA